MDVTAKSDGGAYEHERHPDHWPNPSESFSKAIAAGMIT